ncbi:MAG TPA: glycosyltransferase [Anaerolineae bacterium]|nr:glycosyltransferase [Anaerolineae bacterium]
MRRIAMLSIHTCPMAALGGKETGGMNVYVRELSREIGARGLAVDIFTRSQDPSRQRVRNLWPNVRVIHVPAGPEEPYDKHLVFNHLPQFTIGLREFAAAEGASYDLVHSHYWLSGWVARELAREWRLPTVHMFHTLGKMKNAVAQSEQERAPSERIRVEGELMRDMDRVVAATPLDRGQMVDLYGIDPKKIRIIPLGVDLDLFRPIPRDKAVAAIGVDIPSQHHLVLFVGRLDPLKGLETLFQALCRLRRSEPRLAEKMCLAVIGGDADRDSVRLSNDLECLDKLKQDMDVTDLVVFLGSRAQNTLPYYYSAAEVCVVPSHYESFGLVALEAMACGTPVIASRVGGLQLTVEDGVTGFLVPAGDADALAEKLKLILLGADLRKQLAANARRRAQAYTWQSVADHVIDLYEELWQQAL